MDLKEQEKEVLSRSELWSDNKACDFYLQIMLPLWRERKGGWAWRGWVQEALWVRTVKHELF